MCKTCGCCSGVEPATPQSTANRPGLSALRYRVGTHGAFLRTMQARLTLHSLNLDAEEDPQPGQDPASQTRQAANLPPAQPQELRPLQALTTRAPDDPSMAFLDAWATVGDVLTFYQERIANEGYLRTAVQRRSLFELANLVGYRPRPGVSASVFLAYTLDPTFTKEIAIQAGAQVKSIPAEKETAQTFETAEDVTARQAWNNLAPRLHRPQYITLETALRIEHLYLEGVSTRLKANDPLLLDFGEKQGQQVLRRVQSLTLQADAARTLVHLQPVHPLWIAVAALLRRAVAGLESWLEDLPNQHGNARPVALWVDALRALLAGILENIHLGHVPPLQADRASNGASVQRMAMIKDREPAESYIPIDLVENYREFDSEETQKQVIQDSRLVALFADLVVEAARWLRDPLVSAGLVCLAADWVQAAHPISPRDWAGFDRRLSQMEHDQENLKRNLALIFSPAKVLKALAEEQPALEPLVEPVAAVIETARGYTSVEPLREALNGLLKDVIIASTPVAEDEFSGLPNTLAAAESVQKWLAAQPPAAQPASYCAPQVTARTKLPELVDSLRRAPQRAPTSPAQLKRSLAVAYRPASDVLPSLLVSLQPALQGLYAAWAKAAVSPAAPELRAVYALRLNAAPFGYNAPKIMGIKPNPDHDSPITHISVVDGDQTFNDAGDEARNLLYLDNGYQDVAPESWLVLHRAAYGRMAVIARQAEVRPRTAYTISSKTTRLQLNRAWYSSGSMDRLRKTTVLGHSELLPLADEPVTEEVCDKRIELGALVEGLTPGRWLIVTGERTDITGTPGVLAGELAMLQGVEQNFDPGRPGDPTHTTLLLSASLTYRYKRETVTVYGNVVRATHGATQEEALGSGDGGRAWQSFDLLASPLTFLPAPTPSGAESTLEVRVNGVLWHPAASFDRHSSEDHCYITAVDEKGKTSVQFGDGRYGARLPTGIENVHARYRSGLGRAGNVRSDQLKLAVDKPLGVRQVTNPLAASGGADAEGDDQVRRNAPLAVMALDRLVSVRDYEDFARSFAGIAKASAARLTDGRRELVHLTIAGQDEMYIDPTSDLYLNLLAALRRYGDAYQPVQVDNRELYSLIISARAAVLPDYLWENVSADIRAALQAAFAFNRRQLGQDVLAAEVIAAVQAVKGVTYVDLDVLDVTSEAMVLDYLSLPEDNRPDFLTFLQQRRGSDPQAGAPSDQPRQRIRMGMAEIVPCPDGAAPCSPVRPAGLAVLRPDVLDTLFLQEVR